MTETQLAEIEARCAAATPGPWEWIEGNRPLGTLAALAGRGGADWVVAPAPAYGGDASLVVEDVDALFVARARDDVPALVAEVRRLHAALRQTAETPAPPPK